MTAPTTYTTQELAEYMHTVLGDVAAALGWSAPDSYTEAINETLLTYGVSDIADATDIRKLRAIARVEAWKLAVGSLAARYDFGLADRQEFKRSQMLAGAKEALALAQADAASLGVGGGPQQVVGRTRLRYINDPYVENGEMLL